MKRAQIFILFLFTFQPNFAQQENQPLEILLFRYGTSRFPERAVFADGENGRDVDFAWLFYAMRAGGGWILIDPGFADPALVKRFHIAWIDPLKLLAGSGIKAEDVSLVLITHAHFDHIGLADRFPRARVVISEAARREAVARASPPLRDFFRDSPRVMTFRGKIEPAPGLVMEEIGGHAPGSSVIKHIKERIVFTGDEAYLPENWLGPRLSGTAFNAGKNRIFLEFLRAEAGGWLILTMHDPALAPGIENKRRIR